MVLVATDKISRYLETEPDARLSLLTYIKEFPYRQFPSLPSAKPAGQDAEIGIALPDLGVYALKYRSNVDAGAFFITWVGKAEVLRSPAEAREVKTTSVVIVPPRPFDGERTTLPETRRAVTTSSFSFASPAEYEQALARVEQLFNAVSGTAEFEALDELLVRVAGYEQQHLQFPVLTPAEIIKHRMNMFRLNATYLSEVLDDKYDIQSFLDGSLILPQVALDRLYKLVGYKFPAEDTRFIAV